ncbi:hypothetical protein [Pedobacter sp. L105]|uniref:hypothetical protein n=1 Tax=Pedobacter sp. L105 TaxID=1641871 RepID=UPI00131AC66E|nr:hypothetical protein [Pedobacter sp. L105]
MGLEELLLEDAKNQGESQGIKKGIKIGAKQEREQIIHNLIYKTNLPDQQICDLVPVSLNFVKKERMKLRNN